MSAGGTVHIVGAGLAGLSAAVTFAGRGRRVVLHEAAAQAGGRCRSYFDRDLGCRIDNGNHLLLSGNRDAMAYLAAIGARGTLIGPGEPAFPFLDLSTGRRWTLRLDRGRIPWWLFDPVRRVPDTRPADYLDILRLARAGGSATVADIVRPGTALTERLWRPLAIAALNTGMEDGSARLLWGVFRDSFARGGSACLPLVARDGLSESLVDPALAWLGRHGAEIRFGRRLRAFDQGDGRIASLVFADGTETLAPDDRVVLAVPAPVASSLVPGLAAPTEFRAIVNAHYRVMPPADFGAFVGLVGGTAEWVFARPSLLSVTISAADRLVDRPAEDLAPLIWRDVAQAARLDPADLPPWRIVKEKRATFAATPAQAALRPGPRTGWSNLALAGDWTATGLPSTIEGAIRSGRVAAETLLHRSG